MQNEKELIKKITGKNWKKYSTYLKEYYTELTGLAAPRTELRKWEMALLKLTSELDLNSNQLKIAEKVLLDMYFQVNTGANNTDYKIACRSGEGFVYLIKIIFDDSTQLYKVGFSRDVIQRVKTISRGFILDKTYPEVKEIEIIKSYHSKYAWVIEYFLHYYIKYSGKYDKLDTKLEYFKSTEANLLKLIHMLKVCLKDLF